MGYLGSGFAVVIDYIYEGKITIPTENVVEILHVVDYLQMDSEFIF